MADDVNQEIKQSLLVLGVPTVGAALDELTRLRAEFAGLVKERDSARGECMLIRATMRADLDTCGKAGVAEGYERAVKDVCAWLESLSSDGPGGEMRAELHHLARCIESGAARGATGNGKTP